MRDSLIRIIKLEGEIKTVREEHRQELDRIRADHRAEKVELVREIRRWQQAFVRITGQSISEIGEP